MTFIVPMQLVWRNAGDGEIDDLTQSFSVNFTTSVEERPNECADAVPVLMT
jgi:hypothetical protein